MFAPQGSAVKSDRQAATEGGGDGGGGGITGGLGLGGTGLGGSGDGGGGDSTGGLGGGTSVGWAPATPRRSAATARRSTHDVCRCMVKAPIL